MIETYKAILRGDRLEWSESAPQQLDTEQGVEVYVTIMQEISIWSKVASDGKAMAKALANLAAYGSISKISDPSAWQHEQRQDRALPGRDI